MADRAHGRRITEMLEYDGGRQVTVYVRPDPPDVVVYGAVFCASPGGGYTPPRVMPNRFPRTYLVAGAEEPFFLENAKRWARALGAAGAEFRMCERAGSHGGAFWRQEFPLMVAWAFAQ